MGLALLKRVADIVGGNILVSDLTLNTASEKKAFELRRYRLIGILLLFMNQTLAVIVILVVNQNKGFEYPGLLIYAMTAYSFYSIIFAIINIVKERRNGSPAASAVTTITICFI